MNVTKTEPVAVGGGVIAVIVATIGVLQGFHVTHWTTDQVSLVLTLLSAVVATITGIVRSRVTPVAAPAISVPLTTNTPKEG